MQHKDDGRPGYRLVPILEKQVLQEASSKRE